MDCQARAFLPLTDEVLAWHLMGKDTHGRDFVAGVYPMLLDECCYFLAVDFDKEAWQDDVLAYWETCRRMGVPAALERSRSGNGGHIWIFFSVAVPVVMARKLGSYLMTETMELRPDVGLKSYDRFFPNQDTLPKGGMGNLIALPLQAAPRQRGNSVFVDDQLQAYDDQWAFLGGLEKVSLRTLEHLVGEAEKMGRVVGVRMVVGSDGDEDGTSKPGVSPWALTPSRAAKNLQSMEICLKS